MTPAEWALLTPEHRGPCEEHPLARDDRGHGRCRVQQDPTVNGRPRAQAGTRLAENWHYDVTDSKRREAIRNGAKPIEWRRLPEVIQARWDAKQGAVTWSPPL